MTAKLISSEETSRMINDFYELLPRFVIAPLIHGSGSGDYLHSIKRPFNWRGQKFVLVIAPARVGEFISDEGCGDTGTLQQRFPGAFEGALEKVLRRLAIPENTDFDGENNALCVSFNRIVGEMVFITGALDFNRRGFELSLEILANTTYTVRKGEANFHFRILEELYWVEKGGEFHYQLRFAPILFGDDQLRLLLES